ncbi:MAG TPA: amino acid ABC transporter permease [Thermodesulfobacteriota bacterium]
MTLDRELLAEIWPLFVRASVTTAWISALSMAIGLVLGLLTALARLSPWRPLRLVARGYVELIRGTPLLVQVYFLYAAAPYYHLTLPPIVSGVTSLSLYVGAYASEILRAGITAVHKGQIEAARSLGMSYWQTLRRVTIPIMAALVTPALTNEFTGVLKWSSILSLITVPELTYRAYQVIAESYAPIEALVLSGLMYWALTDIVAWGGRVVERRVTRHLSP